MTVVNVTMTIVGGTMTVSSVSDNVVSVVMSALIRLVANLRADWFFWK